MTDSDATVQALRQCLDLIEGGEAPEQALARFPEQREALEPLVMTAFGLRSLEMPAVPPTVLAGLSEALDLGSPSGDTAEIADGDASWWSRLAVRLGLASGRREPVGGPVWARALALVVVAALLLTTLALAARGGATVDLPDTLHRFVAGFTQPGADAEATADSGQAALKDAGDGVRVAPTQVLRDGLSESALASLTIGDLAGTEAASRTAASAEKAEASETAAVAETAQAEAARLTAIQSDAIVVVVVPQDTVTPPPPTAAATAQAWPTQDHRDDPRPTDPPPPATSEPSPPASPTADTSASETAEPAPSPTSSASSVVISVLVVDLDGAALAGASVQGWNDDTGESSGCTATSGGACDLRFAGTGRFVVLAELASPPVSRWYDGKTSRDEADRIVLDTPGDTRSILVVLPVGAEPLPTVAEGSAETPAPTPSAAPSALPPSPTAEVNQSEMLEPAASRRPLAAATSARLAHLPTQELNRRGIERPGLRGRLVSHHGSATGPT